MRKLTAITLISIYCFNLFGYIILFRYLEHSAYVQAVETIDNEAYSNSDLVEVKVPYTLPYAFKSNKYERANGFVNVNGVQYNYVKKKLDHDTLYMYCLPSDRQSKLLADEHNYSTLVNGASTNDINKKPGTTSCNFQQIFSAVYHQVNPDYDLNASCRFLQSAHYYADMNLITCFIPIVHQPPKA